MMVIGDVSNANNDDVGKAGGTGERDQGKGVDGDLLPLSCSLSGLNELVYLTR